MSTDEALIAAFRESGSRPALDELLRRHVGRVRAVIYPLVLDPAVADDLTQEVLLRAIRGLSGFDGRAQFSTWLVRVALNTTYRFLDRRGRAPVEFHAELAEPCTAHHDGPEQMAVQAELERALAAALRELSPKLRAAIVLTTMQQLSVSEAAEIEGCSTATLYWRIHQARKLLQRRLEKLL